MAIETKGNVLYNDLTILSLKEMEEQAEVFTEGSYKFFDAYFKIYSLHLDIMM